MSLIPNNWVNNIIISLPLKSFLHYYCSILLLVLLFVLIFIGQGQILPQPQGGYQQEISQTIETTEQRLSGGIQAQSTFKQFQKQSTGKISSYSNGHFVEEVIKD